MDLVRAERQHTDKIMELIEQARAFLKINGVNQWQDGYPDRTCIESDLTKGTGYLCIEQEAIVGYVCVDFSGEPAYNSINGAWLSMEPYVVVHRLALDNNVKGQGLALQVLAQVEAMSKQLNIHSFKIDTDEQNQIMKHILQKNGFTYCGTVCFQNSNKLAFEKLL